MLRMLRSIYLVVFVVPGVLLIDICCLANASQYLFGHGCRDWCMCGRDRQCCECFAVFIWSFLSCLVCFRLTYAVWPMLRSIYLVVFVVPGVFLVDIFNVANASQYLFDRFCRAWCASD